MPKDHKKRGRRDDQKKRKRDLDDDASAKRLKKEDVGQLDAENPAHHVAKHEVAHPDATPVYYGMLDEQEQEYFKKADEMLELNQFESSEDRDIFLASVWKEADGKELKIANSQTSRLLERLILLSSPDQLKGLFQKFSGQYVSSRSFRIQHANPSQLPQPRPEPIRLPLLRSPLYTSCACRYPRDCYQYRKNTNPAVVGP
jgi:nucleolar protein 9